MTSLLSFSWRRAQETSRHHHRATANNTNSVNRPEIDPWGLGIATSTSSADSLAIRNNSSNGEETQFSTVERVRTIPVPTTPEGLRPRKSIHKVRQELLGYSQHQNTTSTPFRYNVSPGKSLNSSCVSKPSTHAHSILTMSHLPTSFTYEAANLPTVLHCQRESPQTTLHSSLDMNGIYDYNEQAEHIDADGDEYYDDIVSMIASPSIGTHSSHQKVAVSPDLKPGKAKTAVGAILAAMVEKGMEKYSLGPEVRSPTRNDKVAPNEGSLHSILPSREWMEHEGDRNFVVGVDTMRDALPKDDLDDTESSMHGSPSSNAWRPSRFTCWKDRQVQFQQDTSFTRNILSQDPNASWQQGNGKDNQPYDFEPILSEEEQAFSLKDSIDAPRVLDLIHDHGGLNVSAISSSYHPRETGSLHSLADTIEDDEEEEDYSQINRYQPLIDDTMLPGEEANDDALLLLKAHNQRRIKEQLLLSTLERLCDDLGLLKEVCTAMERSTKCPSPSKKFLLGLHETDRTRIIQEIESLSKKLNVHSNQESKKTERLALQFCFMILQMAMNATSKSTVVNIYAPRHYWKPLPGFRVALGLEEDPVSPPTIRGGDSSLFSLPSDSANANDDTPHTSNVSMATTITTVISPEKKSSQRHLPNSGLAQTFESVIRLLAKLEVALLLLVTVNEKLKIADEISQIYQEFLQLPVSYLKNIICFFELHYEYPPLATTARTVSEDNEEKTGDYEEKTKSFLHNPNHALHPGVLPPPDQREIARNAADILVTQTRSFAQDALRIKLVENEGDEIGQEVECDLWTPNTQDMNSYVHLDDDGPNTVSNAEHSESTDHEEMEVTEDLRRTVGSFDELSRAFDLGSVQEERDGTPSEDDNVVDDQYEEEMILGTSGARRNNVAGTTSRWRNRGFWTGRRLGSRQLRFRCAE
jgi:hypothetical protein